MYYQTGADDTKLFRQSQNDATSQGDHKIFVIVLVVSITGVFIGFIALVSLVYCCKSKMAARRREKEERASNNKRLNWKIDNWFRQRDIDSINRKISKVNSSDTTLTRNGGVAGGGGRGESNHRVGGTVTKNPYRGDIVRSSISTPSVVDFRHNFGNGTGIGGGASCDNVFDMMMVADDDRSMSTRFTSLSRMSADNVSNIATITSMHDSHHFQRGDRFLSPIDVTKYSRDSDIYSESGDEFSSVSQNNTLDRRFYIREHRTLPYGLQWLSPKTSRQIFFSKAQKNDKLAVNNEDRFSNGPPLYYRTNSNTSRNSQSNLLQHFEYPPDYVADYDLSRRSVKECNGSGVDSDSGNYSDPKELDESGYSIFKQELFKKISDASFYEIATKV